MPTDFFPDFNWRDSLQEEFEKNKGKAKPTTQAPDDTEKPKRKRTRLTESNSVVGNTSDNEGPSNEPEPHAKRIKRDKPIDDTGIIPCLQWIISQIECQSNAQDPRPKSEQVTPKTQPLPQNFSSRDVRFSTAPVSHQGHKNEAPEHKTPAANETLCNFFFLTF
jgi:hypothetical protein